MSYKDREKELEYHREYNKKKYHERRNEWFSKRPCVKCGSKENLELHHTDSSTKISHSIWTWTEERRLLELEKCQSLCHDCHMEETIKGIKEILGRPEAHGTRNCYMKYGCRCQLCVDAAKIIRNKQREASGRKHQLSYAPIFQ